MATKRERPNGTWEFIFRSALWGGGQRTLTFDYKEDGERYAKVAEAMLASGVIPPELRRDEQAEVKSFGHLLDRYALEASIKDHEQATIRHVPRYFTTSLELSKLNYAWVEQGIHRMKLAQLAPGTIAKHVGTIRRTLDWAMRRGFTSTNPCHSLPHNFSAYSEADAQAAGGKVINESRDRRLEEDEELRIRESLEAEPPEMLVMFELALETAMRMREINTLMRDQVDLQQRTIFLTKTKNGSKRQVPLSTVACRVMTRYLSSLTEDKLFSTWDGSHHKDNLKACSDHLSYRWRKVFKRAGVEDFHFHDLRHEATSRIYERTNLSDLEISKITGHKSLAMLSRYANLRGSTLATRLW